MCETIFWVIAYVVLSLHVSVLSDVDFFGKEIFNPFLKFFITAFVNLPIILTVCTAVIYTMIFVLNFVISF